MVDRRIVATGLLVTGLALGWYLRVLIAGHARHAAVGGDSALAPDEPDGPGGGVTAGSGGRAEAFDDIYRTGKWGTSGSGAGTSGSGSTLLATVVYRAFLQEFMKDAQIHSVVDAGCGDWEFSQAIDWTGIDYKGFDIVASVIEQDRQRYGKPNIQFFTADIVEQELPPADLLISKHVLQHLPNADVLTFLRKQLPRFKHVLLTNTVGTGSLSSRNPDIKAGEFRRLDLSRPPFNLRGVKLLTYFDGVNMQQVFYVPGGAAPTR